MITPGGRFLGGRLSLNDSRDHVYPATTMRPLLAAPPPRRVDRRDSFPICWNQTSLGCCTGHAGAAKLWELWPGYMASRLAAYYWGRYIEGNQDKDTGQYTRTLMKVLQRGVLPESEWQYDINRFAILPPAGSTVRGIGSYSRITDRDAMVDYIANEGSMVFSFMVPTEFDNVLIASRGIMAWNRNSPMIAAHDVIAVGYDLDFKSSSDFAMSHLDSTMVEDEMALVRNSWGTDWALNGYFWMPFSWILDSRLGGDAWAVHAAPTGPELGGIPIQGSFQS